jgi:hypothetical protein
MRSRSTVLVAVLLTALTTTGCEQAGASAPPDWPTVAGRDLNCATEPALLIGDVDTYDIDRDGTPDFFVTMQCPSADGSRSEPGQLEVFRGGTPRENPVRLTVVVHNWQHYHLTGCVGFAHGKAFTRGTKGGTEVVWGARQVTKGKRKQVEGFAAKDEDDVTGCV